MANVQQGQHELLLILDFGGQYKELIAQLEASAKAMGN